MKKLLPLVAAATFLMSSTVLAASSLTYVVGNESDTFDPGTTNETYAAPIIGNTFEGLVRTAPNGATEGAIAKDWSISDDGLTYTFNLREDAKWSDGKALTAQDFVYAWMRVLDPKSGAKNTAMLYHIAGAEEHFADTSKPVSIKAEGDHKFSFTLKQRVPYMMDLLSYSTFFPVRADVVDADPQGWSRKPKSYIGNGPFRMTEMNIGKSIVFEKNPNYYAADKVMLDNLTFRLIANQATALAAMEASDVDGIESVPASEIPRLSVESKEFLVIPSLGTTYSLLNPNVKPLDDVRVRKALSMAIDREEIIEFVLQSADIPAVGLVPFGMNVAGQEFRDSVGENGLDTVAKVEEAKKLLAEAGYPNGEGFPDTVFATYASPPIQKLLEAIQQMWKKNLNIEVKIDVSEWKVYYPEVQKTKYQIAQMGWGADYPHPMTFLDNFTTGNPNNLPKWSNVDYDAAIKASKATNDPKESLKQMAKAEELVMDAHVVMPLYHRNSYMMMSTNVKGFWRSTLGVPYFRNVTINGK